MLVLQQRGSDEKYLEPSELHDFRYCRECKYLFLWQQLFSFVCLHHELQASSWVQYLHLTNMKVMYMPLNYVII